MGPPAACACDVSPTPAGLLLAAGGGRRFGGPKALATFGGRLLVERGVALLRRGGADPVVVVLGAHAARVRSVAELDWAQVIVNPDWATGLGSSLRAGLAALEGSAPAVVVALADQPLVGAEAVARVISAWHDGARVAVATYEGRQANPVLLDAMVWQDVAVAAAGDQGARGYLRAHPEFVVAVGCDGTGSPDDIDMPEDLAALAVRAASAEAEEEQPCS